MNKLTEHRAATSQIEKLRNELQLIISEIADLNSTLTSSIKRYEALKNCLQQLKDSVLLHANKTKEWADTIESLSNNRIKALVKHDHDLSEIIDAFDILSAKTGSHETNRHQRVRNEVENCGLWPFIDAAHKECLFALRWKFLSSLAASDKPECNLIERTVGDTARILDCFFQLIDIQRLSAILTAVPKPEIELYYCDIDHQIPFESASEGQRAAALLFMLLEQPGGPLIIDQPEGDLDNKIVSSLSEVLHLAKTRRQIIFASHNANIVVNGAAELVVSMAVTPDGKRGIACSGAIDIENVRSAITETMEGGKKAFQDRKAKYGY